MFGITKCAKCDNNSFRVQELSADGASYKFMAVQCMRCSTAIGFTDYYNLGALIKGQEKEIADLKKTVRDIQTYVHQIASNMRR